MTPQRSLPSFMPRMYRAGIRIGGANSSGAAGRRARSRVGLGSGFSDAIVELAGTLIAAHQPILVLERMQRRERDGLAQGNQAVGKGEDDNQAEDGSDQREDLAAGLPELNHADNRQSPRGPVEHAFGVGVASPLGQTFEQDRQE